MTHTIDYYYASMSGYAYLGEQRLQKIADETGSILNYKPINIAKVFESSSTTAPFKQSEQRLSYRLKDMQRTADFLGLPINPKPKHWPTPVVLSSCTIYAAIELGAKAHDISFAILKAIYQEEKDIAEPETIRNILQTLDLDVAAVETLASSDEIKTKFESATQEAIALGVFGSPTYVLDGKELFFGQDRLEMLYQTIKAF